MKTSVEKNDTLTLTHTCKYLVSILWVSIRLEASVARGYIFIPHNWSGVTR